MIWNFKFALQTSPYSLKLWCIEKIFTFILTFWFSMIWQYFYTFLSNIFYSKLLIWFFEICTANCPILFEIVLHRSNLKFANCATKIISIWIMWKYCWNIVLNCATKIICIWAMWKYLHFNFLKYLNKTSGGLYENICISICWKIV